MSTPEPTIGITIGKPYILVQETGLFIMKPTETSVLIKPTTCITFTEHTKDRGDITHTGIITSIDLSIDTSKRGDGLIQCRCGSKKTSFIEKQLRSADEPKRHGLKSIAPRTSGPCARKNRLDFQTPMMAYVSC